MKIESAKQARTLIGTRVWWDDVGPRYIFLRSGILDAAEGRNVSIDGNWQWRTDLKNLRTEKGSEEEWK